MPPKSFSIPPGGAGGFQGYTSNVLNCPPDMLAPPSINSLVDVNGKATSRLGYAIETGITLGVSGSAATCFYLEDYDITVFALGTKIKYYDWNTLTVYDTGLTMTSGTTTRFETVYGDIYATNTTDGLKRLIFGRLVGAVTAGDSSIKIDSDMYARLDVFSITSGNLQIQGTNEAFSSLYSGSISGAASNGSGLVRITTNAPNTLVTGDTVVIAGIVGTTEANGGWIVTVVDTTHFDLQGSTFTNMYSSAGTWKRYGTVPLSGSASKAYKDKSVLLVTQDISAGREKASKVVFWKNRLGLMGSINAGNSGQPNATAYFSKFASPDSNLKNIIDFTYGSGGSDKEVVGNAGRLTNMIGVKDFIYFFNQHQGYDCAASSVVTSGSGIGQTTPDLKDEIHGCINEDCACVIGNNEITYITPDHRILKIAIATDTGAAVAFPDETFDLAIKEDLANMDADQTGARCFYYKTGRKSIYQIRILGQWYWYIYDWTIIRAMKMGNRRYKIIQGAFLPPQQVFFATDFFERKGILYGTDGSDQTVYNIGQTFDDNGQPFLSIVATGNFDVQNAMMKTASLQGEVSYASKLKIQTIVTNETGGAQAGSQKIIDGSKFSYGVQHGVGADPVGGGNTVSIPVMNTAAWQAQSDIYPSEANRVQLLITNEDGGYFTVSQYSLDGASYPSSSNSL